MKKKVSTPRRRTWRLKLISRETATASTLRLWRRSVDPPPTCQMRFFWQSFFLKMLVIADKRDQCGAFEALHCQLTKSDWDEVFEALRRQSCHSGVLWGAAAASTGTEDLFLMRTSQTGCADKMFLCESNYDLLRRVWGTSTTWRTWPASQNWGSGLDWLELRFC